MSPDPTSWQFPVLAAVSAPFHIQGIRELSAEEQSKIDSFTKVSVDARNRFKLFTILQKNYDDWTKYIQSLFTQDDGFNEDEMVNLDRLQLNYLSSAKSLLDQFRQHWIQVYRNTDKASEYDEFLKTLENNSWAFAFFQDLRNFTQHCGLPTGNYSRNVNINSINIRIEADSAWLMAHYARWDKSKLSADRGKLNLLELLREYHQYLHQYLGSFLAHEFAPALLEAHNFFSGLAREVYDVHPKAAFKIITSIIRNGNSFNFEFKTPPANLLGSIGITITNNG
jgi:hypothetical protein